MYCIWVVVPPFSDLQFIDFETRLSALAFFASYQCPASFTLNVHIHRKERFREFGKAWGLTHPASCGSYPMWVESALYCDVLVRGAEQGTVAMGLRDCVYCCKTENDRT